MMKPGRVMKRNQGLKRRAARVSAGCEAAEIRNDKPHLMSAWYHGSCPLLAQTTSPEAELAAKEDALALPSGSITRKEAVVSAMRLARPTPISHSQT